MDSTGQIGKEPTAEEVSLQSSSSSGVNDNIPTSSDVCSVGIDPPEGCLIDLTDERMETTCNINSSLKFISVDPSGHGTSHPDVNLWSSGTKMDCIKTGGLSPGQSLANVLQDHFQLEHSLCNTAVMSPIELAVKHQLSAAKTNYQLGAQIEKQLDEEKVANAAFRMEMKDACTIQKAPLGKTPDTDQMKTSARQFTTQVEVGTDSSCGDLLSGKTEDVCYLQHNPHCILAKAATHCNHQRLSSPVENSNLPKHVKLVTAESLSSCNGDLYRVSSDDWDLATYSQDAHKLIATEQLNALSVSRPMFLWQYLYPPSLSTSVSWSTEFVQDKGWHQPSPGSFTWCQAPAKPPISFAAIDALTKTGTSNCLTSKPLTTSPLSDKEHLANGCAKSAAEDAVKTAAAMLCLVSSHSASSLAAGSPLQLGSEVCDPRLNMTPVPSAYGTSALDHEVSYKRHPSSENMFRSLSARPCRESLLKSAEKRKALLCSTVNVYGHNQPRCYVPPVNNNQPSIIQSPVNSQAMTRQSPVYSRACPSSVSGQPRSSIPSPVQDVSKTSLLMQSPSSSLSHEGPGHECQNMIECTTCVLDFSKRLALALAFDVMHRRTTANPLISSKQQDVSYDKDAKQTTPTAEKLWMQL